MRWLHISDLHYNYKKSNLQTKKLREELINTLASLKNSVEFVAIDHLFLTGDYRNALYQKDDTIEKDVNDVVEFILQIADTLDIKKENIYYVCGNHDLTRSVDNKNSDNSKDDYKKFVDSFDCELKIFNLSKNRVNLLLEKRFVFFRRFCEKMESEGIVNVWSDFASHPYTEYEDFNLLQINSCLTCDSDNDRGELKLQTTCISDLVKNKDKPLIILSHHEIDHFSYKERNEFRSLLSRHKQVVFLCGDAHLPKAKKTNNIYEIISGCLMFSDNILPMFSIGEIHKNQINLCAYSWDNLFMEWSRYPLFNKYFRELSRGTLDKNLSNIKHEVIDVICYDKISSAYADIAEEVKTSDIIYFFGIRGNSFVFGSELDSKIPEAISGNENIKFRLLVSYPFCDEIRERLQNIEMFNTEQQLQIQWRKLYNDVKTLKQQLTANYKRPNNSLKFHVMPLNFRMFITSQSLYLSFYTHRNAGIEPVYKYDSNSEIYKAYVDFFNDAWRTTTYTKIEEKMPEKYKFLEKEFFSIDPSLVINLTDQCNMKCFYCPTGGENLVNIEKDSCCSIDTFGYLLEAFKQNCKNRNKLVLRITGGEPLLEFDKLKNLLVKAYNLKYSKVVICTNGTLLNKVLDDVSRNDDSIFTKYRKKVLWKISLDTQNKDTFKDITNGSNDFLANILENISEFSKLNFNVELNTVATTYNQEEIYDLYEFARTKKLIGVKVLTINDFGGLVNCEDYRADLHNLIEKMETEGYTRQNVYLNDNKGIQMKRFLDEDGTTLTIVDHVNGNKSITPARTYSEQCTDCPYFQQKDGKVCSTGIMSLSMRADGLISYCRLITEGQPKIYGKNKTSIYNDVKDVMQAFKKCRQC